MTDVADSASNEAATRLSAAPLSTPPHQRYQFKPFTGSSHWWAIGELNRLPRAARILDIGCGGGAIGKALAELGFGSLHAVEIDAETRERARPVYRKIEATIDPFMSERYEAILLLDVIEHMPDPEGFLARVATLLVPGGLLLISVPNIAHWSVRVPLLFGFFNYTERGLLDRTHLQFFTRRRVHSIQSKIEGLTLRSYHGSIAPAEFVLPTWVSGSAWFEAARLVRKFFAQVLPGLCAFQHLAVFERTGARRDGTYPVDSEPVDSGQLGFKRRA